MEQDLEKSLIQKLQSQEYENVNIRGVEDLKNNLKKQIELNNSITFEGDEFERLYKELTNVDTVFNASKKIRDRLLFERADYTKINLLLYNTTSWCKNTFQVANQILIPHSNTYKKYDVTILINGFPMVQIELKNTNVAIENAFKQIVDDYKKSYQNTLFMYIQLFIISNGSTTKYFVNNSTIDKLSLCTYANEANEPINYLAKFTETFLNKCYLSKIIARYIVLLESKKELRVLRPYQIHAVEKIVNRVENGNNHGYIWHTTGSGKTLTSFKTAIILKNNPNLAKVLFVVDRKDLDQQTITEFNKFEEGCVDLTNNTNALVAKLESTLDSNKLIVTTIQKLHKGLSDGKNNSFKHLRDEKVVFIFDECHRSTFGDSFKNIKKFFIKAQCFGFTGTPIFSSNATSKTINSDGDGNYQTTADIFKENLHSYTIANAIADNAVLGFNINEVSYDFGKAAIANNASNPNSTTGLSFNNLSKKDIVGAIYKKHNHITSNKKFNGIFATNSIGDAIEYYKIFKQYNKTQDLPLKVVAIFSPPQDANTKNSNINHIINMDDLDSEKKATAEEKKAGLDEIQKDYNEIYKLNLTDYTQFYNDVSRRFKNYGTYVAKNQKEETIDILIVVDMFLTGYDSPITNTLYVDKNLKEHGLIQAFSRTNRLWPAKPFGNIITFNDLQEQIDEAIQMYSSNTKNDDKKTFKIQPFSQSKIDLQNALDKFKNNFQNQGLQFEPSNWHNVKSDQINSMLKANFSGLLKAYSFVKAYDLTDEEHSEISNIISKEKLDEFIGVYKDISINALEFNNNEQNEHNQENSNNENQGENPQVLLDNEDIEILFTNYVIDYDYIVNLLYKYGQQIANPNTQKSEQTITKDTLESTIATSSYLQAQADIIMNNFDEIQQGSLNKSKEEFKIYLTNFLDGKKQAIKDNIVKKYNANPQIIDDFISKYLSVGTIDYTLLLNSLPPMGLVQKSSLQKELQKELLEFIKLYN